MSEKPTIYEALAGAMADVGAVRKEQVNQHQRFNFRGVDAVVNAVSPAFRKHGIIVAPTLIEKELRESRTSKGATMANVYVTVRYTFYGPAGDHIEATVAAESFDSGDKATAKAMSVAFRTALLQTLALPTDEIDDPDHHTYERSGTGPAQPVRQAPATPPPAPTEEQVEELGALLEECGYTPDQYPALTLHYTQQRTGSMEELTGPEIGRMIVSLRKHAETIKQSS